MYSKVTAWRVQDDERFYAIITDNGIMPFVNSGIRDRAFDAEFRGMVDPFTEYYDINFEE